MMKHFEEVDDKYVRCIPCGTAKNQLISRSGNTSNLKRHIQRAHFDVYENYLREEGKKILKVLSKPPRPPPATTTNPEEKPSRSRLRNHFFQDADATYWRCKPCGLTKNKLLSKSGNTSNLKRHLQLAHFELYQSYLIEQNKTPISTKPSAKRVKKDPTPTVVVNDENMYTCRACLIVDPTKTFQSLLEEPIRTSFWECTAVEVLDGDSVPLVLCSLCVARCEAAKHFRDMVHCSDDKLRGNQPPPATVTDSVITMDTGVVMDVDGGKIEIAWPRGDEEEYDVQEGAETEGDEEEQYEEEEVNFYETVAEEVIVDEVFEVGYETEGTEKGPETPPISGDIIEEQLEMPMEKQQSSFICEFCEEEFANRTNMASHYQSEHPSEVYTCPECSKTFISAQTWRKHACPVTSVKYCCTICNEIFLRREKMKKHMDEHMGLLKMYQCTICGHEFKQKGNLEAHMKRHSDEKPFECSECQKSFKEKRELIRHTSLVHSKVRPYPCGQCDRAFAYRYMLDRHLRTHTEKKSHPSDHQKDTYNS